MFCPKCGNQLPDGSAFCGKCGAQLGGMPADTPGAAPAGEPAGASAPSAALGTSGGVSTRVLVIAGVALAVALLLALLVGGSTCSSKHDSASSGSHAAHVEDDYDDDAPTNIDELNEYLENGEVSGDGDSDDMPTNINDLNDYMSGESSMFGGTWTDPDYGDTMTVYPDGTAVITQQGVGTTEWNWSENGNGIRISNASNSYDLKFGVLDGSTEVLYNNDKGLYFERS